MEQYRKNRMASDFMKWPADTYRCVFCSEVYNGYFFYEMLQTWVVYFRTGSVTGN